MPADGIEYLYVRIVRSTYGLLQTTGNGRKLLRVLGRLGKQGERTGRVYCP